MNLNELEDSDIVLWCESSWRWKDRLLKDDGECSIFFFLCPLKIVSRLFAITWSQERWHAFREVYLDILSEGGVVKHFLSPLDFGAGKVDFKRNRSNFFPSWIPNPDHSQARACAGHCNNSSRRLNASQRLDALAEAVGSGEFRLSVFHLPRFLFLRYTCQRAYYVMYIYIYLFGSLMRRTYLAQEWKPAGIQTNIAVRS